MNNKKAKQIRKIFLQNDDPTSRRVYRRFKKKYNTVPAKDRKEFLDLAEKEFLKID